MSHDVSHEHEAHAHEPVGYGSYILTWLALLVLTAMTVTAAGMHFGSLSVLVALAIAMVKASIVLFLFMHLKYEDRIFHRLLMIVIAAMVIFIGLTFTDTLFR
ncbi:MAG TPA: cytochrome C oxidase subunit IV family protein [Candidatus Krumholzibacteria bacterium]|nr:cytochrome C oxidase subunit IV family protein [Candidatus Krumholzibacteria bacterium]